MTAHEAPGSVVPVDDVAWQRSPLHLLLPLLLLTCQNVRSPEHGPERHCLS